MTYLEHEQEFYTLLQQSRGAAINDVVLMGKVKIYYFSPTGSTRQVAQHLGELLGAGTCHKMIL